MPSKITCIVSVLDAQILGSIWMHLKLMFVCPPHGPALIRLAAALIDSPHWLKTERPLVIRFKPTKQRVFETKGRWYQNRFDMSLLIYMSNDESKVMTGMLQTILF